MIIYRSNGVKLGGVLSPILFSLYLEQLISRLRHVGMGCYMNCLFTGVFIYADAITLLAPSRASLAIMLEQCESFSRTHKILFNECDLLGIILSSNRTTDNVKEKAVMKFYIKGNEVFSDFKLLPCFIQSKWFTTFCIDAYGCQL